MLKDSRFATRKFKEVCDLGTELDFCTKSAKIGAGCGAGGITLNITNHVMSFATLAKIAAAVSPCLYIITATKLSQSHYSLFIQFDNTENATKIDCLAIDGVAVKMIQKIDRENSKRQGEAMSRQGEALRVAGQIMMQQEAKINALMSIIKEHIGGNLLQLDGVHEND